MELVSQSEKSTGFYYVVSAEHAQVKRVEGSGEGRQIDSQ